MQISAMWGGIVLLCSLFLQINGAGQSLIWKDTMILVTLAHPADSGISNIIYRLGHDLEYSVSGTALLYSNWQKGNGNNNISLLHHLKYRSQITNDKNFCILNSFSHDLGIQYFFDSTSRFQPDENTLITRVEVRIGEKFNFTFFSNLTTRMFDSYVITTTQTGNLMKALNASFLTPMLWTFSTGFARVFQDFGTISLGVSAAKLTWIRNNEVYSQQEINDFYGVPKGKKHIFEYGLSMHVLVDKRFLNRVQWNCDLLIFKDYTEPFDLVMKNLIGIRLTKFLKTSLQTRLFYEKEVSKNIQLENLVSLGFYFNL